MSIFVRVVTHGGFAAVAREADISATMVAKHVQALEAHVGCRLLNRTTRHQRLTEAGDSSFAGVENSFAPAARGLCARSSDDAQTATLH
jgi:DNA-binding transcriptional LysR family regulator